MLASARTSANTEKVAQIFQYPPSIEVVEWQIGAFLGLGLVAVEYQVDDRRYLGQLEVMPSEQRREIGQRAADDTNTEFDDPAKTALAKW